METKIPFLTRISGHKYLHLSQLFHKTHDCEEQHGNDFDQCIADFDELQALEMTYKRRKSEFDYKLNKWLLNSIRGLSG